MPVPFFFVLSAFFLRPENGSAGWSSRLTLISFSCSTPGGSAVTSKRASVGRHTNCRAPNVGRRRILTPREHETRLPFRAAWLGTYELNPVPKHRVRCFMEQEVCHGETAVYPGNSTKVVPLIKQRGVSLCASVSRPWCSPDAIAQLGEAACTAPRTASPGARVK